MNDQPVTPDREAALIHVIRKLTDKDVDALLPLLTDALDRARQQGRIDTTIRRPQRQDSLSDQLWDLQRIARREGMYDADDWIAARLARGGPNRKDEE